MFLVPLCNPSPSQAKESRQKVITKTEDVRRSYPQLSRYEGKKEGLNTLGVQPFSVYVCANDYLLL